MTSQGNFQRRVPAWIGGGVSTASRGLGGREVAEITWRRVEIRRKEVSVEGDK